MKAPPMGKKKYKRKLTPFLCREMLYDFAIGQVDLERKQAIEEYLIGDTECRNELERIKRSLEYLSDLEKAVVDPKVMMQLRESENAISLGKKYSQWKEWPEVIRWSISALGISTIVAMLIAVIPWNKISSIQKKKTNIVEIAQLHSPLEKQLEEIQDQQEGDSTVAETSGDEEVEGPEQSPPLGQNVAARKMEINDSARSEVPHEKPPESSGDQRDSNETRQATGDTNLNASAGQTKKLDMAGVKSSEGKAKGFVFRGFMTLTNLDDVGPKISEHITELGGFKAGEVELGWKRGTGRYYHFAMPTENEEKLLEKLRAYGPVRISKDPHPRVMPSDQIRVILWIESTK